MKKSEILFRECNAVVNFWYNIEVYDLSRYGMDKGTYESIWVLLRDIRRAIDVCIDLQEETDRFLEMSPDDIAREDIHILQSAHNSCLSALGLILSGLSNVWPRGNIHLSPEKDGFTLFWRGVWFLLHNDGSLKMVKHSPPCDTCFFVNSGAACRLNCVNYKDDQKKFDYIIYDKMKEILPKIGMGLKGAL